MEDTEYLPTCGSHPNVKRRIEMKGKFLTKNIILTAVCIGHHCVHTKPLTIEELWADGLKLCPICKSRMIIEEEFVIHN